MRFEPTEAFARKLDAGDSLRGFRAKFNIPEIDGRQAIYLTGNSLGLQPLKTRAYVDEELDRWARLGVEAHFTGKNAWAPYHELVSEPLARVVGAKPSEVVAMNSLTTNLHLLLVSFYRPAGRRRKILIEEGAFPSDQYAVDSHLRFHGLDPADALIESAPGDLLSTLKREGDEIALVLVGNVNYLSGRACDVAAISEAAHRSGAVAGFDLAHGAGNLRLTLHDDGADFAVWCSYKYLNAGPGGIAGCFVHERHATDFSRPRFAGWWGHDKKTRFTMPRRFSPLPGAEGWQLSNPAILQLAALRASLELFDAATMSRLREKSERLTGYLEFCLRKLAPEIAIITPLEPSQRGCQLSLKVREEKKTLMRRLHGAGVICDFREPDVLRAAPVPLYNRFQDVLRFVQALARNETKKPAFR